MKTHRFLIVATFLVVISVVVFFFQSAKASTTVSWEPAKISQAVVEGQSVTITVSINANKNLEDVIVHVVPELQAFISVVPTWLSQVEEGSTEEIHMTISAAPNTPVGMYEGVIQLREGKGEGKRAVLAKLLPVVVHIVEDSVTGDDTNNDGVWDYIENYIEITYPDSPDTRAALRQFAVAFQQALLEANDPTASLRNAQRFERAVECLFYIRPDDADTVAAEFEAQIINTVERSNAYLMYTDQLAGKVTRGLPLSEFGSACEWDQN